MTSAAGTVTNEQNNPKEKFVIDIHIKAVPSSNRHKIFSVFIASSNFRNGTKTGTRRKTPEQIKIVGKATSVAWQFSPSHKVPKYCGRYDNPKPIKWAKKNNTKTLSIFVWRLCFGCNGIPKIQKKTFSIILKVFCGVSNNHQIELCDKGLKGIIYNSKIRANSMSQNILHLN